MKVAVLGGGVIGLCCALSLQRRGFEVVLVDSKPAEADRCSNGNAGMVTPSHFIPLAAPGMIALGLRMMRDPKGPFRIRPSFDPGLLGWMIQFAAHANQANVDGSAELLAQLNLASRDLYARYESEFGPFRYGQKGIFMVGQSEATLAHERDALPLARGLGIDAEWVPKSEIARIEPNIDLRAEGGIWYSCDGTLNPMEFLRQARASFLAHGGNELVGTVEKVSPTSGRLDSVLVDGEELDAHGFVLTAGVWTERLLGSRMPLQPGKGYSFVLPHQQPAPSVATILLEARVAVTPYAEGTRFAGTMEVGDWSDEVSTARVEGICEAIPRSYPQLAGKVTPKDVWHGHRPCSPDGVPYIGAVRGVSNLWVAAGHAMMGMSLGPITGEIIADGIQGKPTGFDMQRLSPNRFA